MSSCRNCGSEDLRELGFIGGIAPFFAKRVFQMELRQSPARHPLRILARRLLSIPQRFMMKVYGESAYVEMQICRRCSFVQLKQPPPDESLSRLYIDYRSESYNSERVRYEPSYAAIAGHIGVDTREQRGRASSLTQWLQGRLQVGNDFSMLDYGGADGRFLPELPGEKFVYEISDIAPLPGVTRIAHEPEPGRYSYVQLAHVLEHVGRPLELLARVACAVKPSGYLYVETPQELSDADFAALQNGGSRRELIVHEHINYYNLRALRYLAENAGLEVLACEAAQVDLGWGVSLNLRMLCRPRTGSN